MPVVTLEWYHGLSMYVHFSTFHAAWVWCNRFAKCKNETWCETIAGFDERDRVLVAMIDKVYKLSLTKGDEKPHRFSYSDWHLYSPDASRKMTHAKSQDLLRTWYTSLIEYYKEDLATNCF